MDNDSKKFKTARIFFNKLKTIPSSVAFAEEILDKKLLLKLKKSKYIEDKIFFKLVNINSNIFFEAENVNRTDYIEKKRN